MTAVMLSAGKASRMGSLAPGGCKALVEVDGVTMFEHWAERFDDLFLVCRSDNLGVLSARGMLPELVVTDEERGPAWALACALNYVDTAEPVTVIYADTWLGGDPPQGDDWTAVAAAQGGRPWYVAEHGGLCYRNTHPTEVVLAGIGLFRFADHARLRRCLEVSLSEEAEVGMGMVHNLYGAPFRPVSGWQDVGTPEALAAWRAVA